MMDVMANVIDSRVFFHSLSQSMIVLTTSVTGGVLVAAMLWMWCHRRVYNWREFGLVLLMMVAVFYRFSMGVPPVTHFIGIVTMNVIYVWMVLLILPRPHHIPMIERRRQCGLRRLFGSASSRKSAATK